MIKASYLQKQGAKYRELARAEVSLEMRRQLFALASRCDELAAAMARWPGPKELAAHAPSKAEPSKLAAAKPVASSKPMASKPAPSAKPQLGKPKPAAVEAPHGPTRPHESPRGASGSPAALPFGESSRARLVHGFAE